jgi:putative transposase
MQYRRAFTPGGSYFFTVVTYQRRPIFATADAVEILRQAFRAVRKTRPFEINAFVAMPDHLHCIWTLPPDDADFATRWRLIKTWFTKHYADTSRPLPDLARQTKHEQALWQHRYWEHCLRDENDYARHVEYIHYNPVKHGYVSAPIDWTYSSIHRHIAAGIVPPDWGCGEVKLEGIGHE